jgi:hypothetical protein
MRLGGFRGGEGRRNDMSLVDEFMSEVADDVQVAGYKV